MAGRNMIQALNAALREEMRRDPSVVVVGEDVGALGGAFQVTAGLLEEFGEARCLDAPLAESGIVGAAIGMALYGLRPVAEIQFADFLYPAFEQIVNEAAKMRYRSGGEYAVPLTIRAPYGGGVRGGPYHSQSPEAHLCHTPGLKVVVPSDPASARGLLLAAIRDPDPVVFLEPKRIYRSVRGEIAEGEEGALPLGRAEVAREGSDVTVVAWGAMLHEAAEAADRAAEEGISCEVIDLRSLVPVDAETVAASVGRTGRCVVVHEAPRTCGYGAELAALVAERAFLSLEAPVRRVTGWDTPYPDAGEEEYLPGAGRILRGIRETAGY
jgi:2-oxoisovalerate dehydrogenase E1 component beta subunit